MATRNAARAFGQPAQKEMGGDLYALVQEIDEEPLLAVRLRTTTVPPSRTDDASPSELIALSDIDPTTFYATGRS